MGIIQAVAPKNVLADGAEISFIDIAIFLQCAWKKLLIAAISGAILGLAMWFFFGKYQAEITIFNNGGTDQVGWRILQKSLPNLANQILEEKKFPPNQELIYKTLSDDQWWQKNAVANYALTKAEAKSLVSTTAVESAGASVFSIAFTAAGSSKDNAQENVIATYNFMLQGAAFLAIKSMINNQESQALSLDADISRRFSATQLELTYQLERLRNLENLAKRFQGEQKTISQVVDPKESGAKYLPLSTQIIATNTEINGSKEALERLKQEREQAIVLKAWLTQASPLVDSTYDGITLIQQLLERESALRATINPQDLKSLVFVDTLRSALLGNQVRFTKGFEYNNIPVVTKKGIIMASAVGLVATLSLMLMFLLAEKFWSGMKERYAEAAK